MAVHLGVALFLILFDSSVQDFGLRCPNSDYFQKPAEGSTTAGLMKWAGSTLLAWETLSNNSLCNISTKSTGLSGESKDRSKTYVYVCSECPNCLVPYLSGPNVLLVTQVLPTNGTANITVLVVEKLPPSNIAECTLQDDPSEALRSFSKTSVLFVSISFIILMVISLAWLVFYYVQRFRYAHAKDRLQRRLFNAAKKALGRMPAKGLKQGDAELDGDCAVCIDPYAAGDIVRTLPCRHVFHKTCIDPWLLEHRTCPMCKADILKAFGYQVCASDRSERGHRAISPEEGSVDEAREAPREQSPRTTALFIERTRPIRVSRDGSSDQPSARPSTSHVVNLVHVRARSQSCVRSATFRSPRGHHSPPSVRPSSPVPSSPPSPFPPSPVPTAAHPLPPSASSPFPHPPSQTNPAE